MEQFESLLTCCVCLDRYRNPKLLPCQHSYCMEPCMDGLVDYVRRQVKCPECRTEHRIPYQGVQGFPTNVTLQRFLELHQQIAGELPDPTAGQVMERCNVCSEKAYCAPCAHCDKKVCEDCKSSHMEVLRREIARINNQIRRGTNRIQDILAIVERNTANLQTNCAAVAGEVEEIHKRLAKALKDRTDFLRNEVDRYLATELRNLTHLKDNLELELTNIQSNCDLADKYMNDDVEWEDTELVDTKEIFLKTVEFLRNFEYEAGDYNRRIRFIMTHDPNQLVMHVASYGELNINTPTVYGGGMQPSTGGLTRSKSDHRLAIQFRQQEEAKGYYDNDEPLLGGRKFGERRPPPPERQTRDYGGDNYSDYESEHRPSRRFRSRFVKSHHADPDSDTEQTSRVVEEKKKEKEKVADTEDATKGPLSGIFRLSDCPRVMQRILDADSGKKKEKKEVAPPPKPVQPTPQPTPQRRPPTARQLSEDDEIARVKRQNKAAASSSQEPERSTPRVEEERSSITRKPPTPAREASSDDESDGSMQRTRTEQRKAAAAATKPAPVTTTTTTRRPSATEVSTGHRPAARAPSTESSASTESSGSAVKHTGTERTTPVATNGTANSDTSSEEETDSSEESEEEPVTQRKPESQAMARSDIGPLLARSTNARNDAKDNKSNNESPAPTRYRTRQASQTEEEEKPTSRYGSSGSSYSNRYGSKPREEENTSSFDDESKYPTARSRYLALKERRNRLARSKSSHTGFGVGDDDDLDDPVSPTTASPSAYLASRYGSGTVGTELSRSRSSHALKSRESSPERVAPGGEKDGAALSSWARYLKNKYGSRGKERDTSGTSSTTARRLSLGLPLRSANELASSDDDSKNAAGSPISPTAATAAVAGFAAAGSSPRSQYLQKRRLQFSVGSRGSEPGSFTWPRGIAVGPDNTMVVADSSNHRVQVFDSNGIFIKEFGQYGSGEGEFDCLAGVAVNRIGQYIIADRYNHRIQVFDPAGRFLRAFGSQGTGDGKFNYPWGITTDALGFIYVCDKENHRVQVFQSDGTFVGKFGSFGSKLGQLEHPHYIAVSSTNRVLVSDSNNHRIQVFDVNGRVLSSFGEEGSEDGQFKFPRGVAVDDQGYIVVADSGNNRIQIFHPDGTFLRAFGSWGNGVLRTIRRMR
ncbi:NHL repeat domain-containing protein [Phthorimaea operculella]|nr:NHL repeat domain-containing protein [Phthorimaea operculella]